MNTYHDNTPHTDGNRRDLIAFIRPIRLSMVETSEGWHVDISSLEPGDAMMALTRDESLEHATILCGAGATSWVACVDGPVETGDANAIIASVSSSNSPLAAECRMQSIITSTASGGMSAHVRNHDDALSLVAEAFRQYASNLLNCSPAPPELGLVATLFENSDVLSVRPIETEVYSTFLDVGISSTNETAAEYTLIYDIHSDTWHGD